MKTIDEAAKEAYVKSGRNVYFDNGFKSDIAFAQQWIPVENELPEIKEGDFSEDLLLKLDNGAIVTGYMFIDGDFLAYDESHTGHYIKRKVVSWRQIERK